MSNVQRYRDFVDRAYNQGDLSVVHEIISPDYVEHQYPVPDIHGIDAVLHDVTATRSALAGIKLSIEDITESGDKLWSRIECHAIDPETSKAVCFSVMDICRFRDGKMVEHWGIPDRFALLHQLGRL